MQTNRAAAKSNFIATATTPVKPRDSAAALPVEHAPTPEALSASEPIVQGEHPRPQGPDRRKSRIDRRTGLDRRVMSDEASDYDGPERRTGKERRVDTGLERRRGPGRRRSDERREAEEGEMNGHQFEFVMAVEAYKKINKRLYPTWTEILEVLTQLGYRKVLPRTIKLDAPEASVAQIVNGVEVLPPEADAA